MHEFALSLLQARQLERDGSVGEEEMVKNIASGRTPAGVKIYRRCQAPNQDSFVGCRAGSNIISHLLVALRCTGPLPGMLQKSCFVNLTD